jgi:peroxiredoxin
LGRLYPQFQAAGTDILVILGDSPDRAARYAHVLGVPFPVLADPSREVYHRFGLEKAYLLLQRTASVVIDRSGRIRYMKRVANPMAWLQENQELVDVVKGLANA